MTRGSTRAVAAAWAVVCGTVYALLPILRFRRFELASWDNGIFEQVVRSYAHLQAPVADVKGPGYVILGDHFSPVVALLAPFYRLWPSAQTLMVAQAVLFALSVYVIASLALRTLGWWTGGALALAYGISFGLVEAAKVDFHEIAFAVPLLALAGTAWLDDRPRAVVLWSLPLVLVKEDLGLTVLMIGLVLALRPHTRRVGALLALAGMIAFVVTVAVILPAFNPGGEYAYTENLSTGPFTALDTKATTVALTLGVSGFAALLSPWTLLLLPTFAWRFLGDVEYYWGTEWHYSAVLMPIVAVAAIDVMRRVEWTRPLAFLAIGMAVWTLPDTPLTWLAGDDAWDVPERAHTMQELVDEVPKDASVETDIAFLTHLTTDHEVYWLGTVGEADPDWVLFDTFAGIGSPSDPVRYAEENHGGTWEVVESVDGLVLARRVDG